MISKQIGKSFSRYNFGKPFLVWHRKALKIVRTVYTPNLKVAEEKL